MKLQYTLLLNFSKYSALAFCLFMLISCDEVRIIEEKDIPNIKPGGSVRIETRVGNTINVNLLSECELLGVREIDPYFNARAFRADLQTVGKPENLLFTVTFLIDELVTPDSAICEVIGIDGNFKYNNTTYNFRDSDFDFEIGSVRFGHFSEKGKMSHFSLNAPYYGSSGFENWAIKVSSTLLP